MARRVLLVELGEKTQFDSATAGSGVILSNGNKNCSRTAATATGSVRSGRARLFGKLMVAFEIVSTGTTDGCHFGLSTQLHQTSAIPGGASAPAAEAWGCFTGTTAGAGYGTLHNNSLTATSAAISTGQYGLMAVDLDAGKIWFGKATALSGGTVTWYGSGVPSTGANASYTNLLTAGTGGLLGVSGSGTLKRSVRRKFYICCGPYGQNSQMRIVSDLTSLREVLPAGFTPWGEIADFGSEGFCSYPSDTPANTYYAGRLMEDGDPEYNRSVSVAEWGGERAPQPISNFELDNTDGALDWLASLDLRDVPARWRMGSPDAATATFTEVGNSIIEAVDAQSEKVLRVIQKDLLAQLEVSVQEYFYPVGSIPNTALENKPFPFCFGLCTWVPLLVADPPNLEYHLHEDEWGGVTELRDQGVAITAQTGYDYGTRTDCVGVRRITNPAGKQVATMRGQVTLGTEVLGGSGQFSTWTADNPNGFTVTETLPTLVTQTVAGECRFVKSNASVLRADSSTNVFTNGQLYFAQVVCTNYASGVLNIGDSAGNIFCQITKTGTYRFGFVGTGTNALRLDAPNNPTDLRIDGLVIYVATLVERLPAVLTHLCVTDGPLEAANLDSAGTIATLDTAAAYKHGFWTDASVRKLDVLRKVMDGYTGALWSDRLNKIKVGQLTLPSSGGSPTVFSDIELYGDILIKPDLAKGLSGNLAGVRNYGVHAEGEIAGSLLSTGSGRTTAAQLKEQYLAIKAVGPLAGCYDFAKSAKPLETLLSNATDTGTEATRKGPLWAQRMAFFYFQAFVDGGSGYLLEPFTDVLLQTSRFGMTAGHPVKLISIRSRWLSDLVTFVAWGTYPAQTPAAFS